MINNVEILAEDDRFGRINRSRVGEKNSKERNDTGEGLPIIADNRYDTIDLYR